MKTFINIRHFGMVVVVIIAALTLSGCATPGKIGQMSKFDIATASSEDIAAALKEDGRVAISGGLLFETDSAKIAPSATDVLTRLSDTLQSHPDIKVAVVGHTDSTGDFNYNVQLSERRAKAIVQVLVKNGIASDRLAAVGVGPLIPINSNDTVDGRSYNRRVEVVLIR